jgi:hypothetical protein
MRAPVWAAVALAAAVSLTGCQSTPARRTIASTEPGLAPSPDASGSTVATTPPPRSVTFVDRHPLFSKPRDYYENSGDNTIVKAAAATVIGIPAGLFGELKQIVVGAPSGTRY